MQIGEVKSAERETAEYTNLTKRGASEVGLEVGVLVGLIVEVMVVVGVGAAPASAYGWCHGWWHMELKGANSDIGPSGGWCPISTS